MPWHSYRERDYSFGQAMLRLRYLPPRQGSSIGLTQAGLAALLGVSRCAVAEWEAGSIYPKAEHLQRVPKRSDGWGRGCNQMDQSGEDMALAHSSPSLPLAYIITTVP